ncbi:hypothetical protein LBMAG21_07950 [Armatimonadota bacterium]|nr:hypothetical protein LBMAG21_07950 [Armatimonadota bacterium]
MAENLYTVHVESIAYQDGYVYVEARDEEHLKGLLANREFVESLESDIEWITDGSSGYCDLSDFEVTDVL